MLTRTEEFTPGSKRLCSDAVDGPISCDTSRLAYSQPGLGFSGSQPVRQNYDNDAEPDDHLSGAVFSFSQPADIDDMLLNSQVNTQTASGNSVSSPLQRLVKRMTRLVAKVSCEEAIKHLCQHLTKLGYSWKIHTPGVVISTNELTLRKFLILLSRLPFRRKTGVRCNWCLRLLFTTCSRWCCSISGCRGVVDLISSVIF